MTPEEALRIFTALGAAPAELDPESLHRAWIRAARVLHPDQGGHHDQAALLNAAYTVLSEDMRTQQSAYAARRRLATMKDPKRHGIAVWAWAGAQDGIPPSDHIARFDLTDRRFVQRTLWELSGHSQEEWTI